MGSGGGVGGIGGGAGHKGDVGQGGNGAYCGSIVATGQNGAGVSGGAGGGVTPAGPGAGNRNRGAVGYLDFQMPGSVCLTAGNMTPLFFGGYYTCGGGGTLTYCVP
jgi:hypothetical protein